MTIKRDFLSPVQAGGGGGGGGVSGWKLGFGLVFLEVFCLSDVC